MKEMAVTLITAGAMQLSAARADVISEWNKIAHDYINQNAPAQDLRGKAMVHVAQFDAVNGTVGGYFPYALYILSSGASPEAAAAQAAYTVLTNISRANISALNAALARSLLAVPEGAAKEDGIRLGRLAADAIIQLRAADNLDLRISPAPGTLPGRWRPTPPSLAAGVGAQYRYVVPWTARSVSQFRPGPPPDLRSTLYAEDYNEVRLRGARTSTNRTPDQVEGARFHDAVGDQEYLAAVSGKRSLALIDSARMFALYYMVLADALTAVFEAKYAYNYWRPITAIRLGESDGNDATPADAGWNSFIDTHPHPEYPSAACQNTAATIEVLIDIYGNDLPISVMTSASPKPRSFLRLSDAIDDVIEGRISAGMHFRNSGKVAVEAGRAIAQNALQNFLRPLPKFLSAGGVDATIQLNLATGAITPFVIETSDDLQQWRPWQTNVHGILTMVDPSPAADRRFYRAVRQNP